MPYSEIVEAEGHLVDSQILSRIFDRVIECGCAFEVVDFRLGRTNEEFSRLKLRVVAPDRSGARQSAGRTGRARLLPRRDCRRCFSGLRPRTASFPKTSIQLPITGLSCRTRRRLGRSRRAANGCRNRYCRRHCGMPQAARCDRRGTDRLRRSWHPHPA